MNIAYARYNQNTDLDYAIASVANRGTELRVGILEALVELGHDITIVSWVNEKHRHALKGESLGRFDNSWMTALKWNMSADMQTFDLMIVETASANTMYSFKWDDETVGYVEHMADLLYDAKGVPIIIYHHGPAVLAFPFSRLSCTLTDPLSDMELLKLSPRNYRNIFRGMDIWDGYDYTVWHQAYTSKHFLRDGAMRKCYARPELQDVLKKFVATDMGYSPRYDIMMPPRDPETAQYDLVYVGKANKKERIAKTHRYYDNPEYSSLLIGQGWDEEQWKYDVTAPGRSKYHGDVQDHYERGLACVQISDNDLATCGMATTRLVEAIRSGCVFMVDDAIAGGERWVGEEFVVSSPDDVLEIIIECCDNADVLAEVNEHQKSMLKQWVDVMSRVLNVATGKEEPDEI